jgi:hypothetical protein
VHKHHRLLAFQQRTADLGPGKVVHRFLGTEGVLLTDTDKIKAQGDGAVAGGGDNNNNINKKSSQKIIPKNQKKNFLKKIQIQKKKKKIKKL